jgi:hypothetical protein
MEMIEPFNKSLCLLTIYNVHSTKHFTTGHLISFHLHFYPQKQQHNITKLCMQLALDKQTLIDALPKQEQGTLPKRSPTERLRLYLSNISLRRALLTLVSSGTICIAARLEGSMLCAFVLTASRFRAAAINAESEGEFMNEMLVPGYEKQR